MTDRTFRIGVGVVAAAALAIRWIYILRIHTSDAIWGDQIDYFWGANALVHGQGFTSVLASVKYHTPVPSAAHPPGFTVLLALLREVGLTSVKSQRLAVGVLGVATVLVIVALVNRLAGRRAALVAGTFAACYPQLWINDTMLMSESLFQFGIALGFLGVYSYRQDRRVLVLLVATFGFTLAASARAESLLLFPFVVVPLVGWARSLRWRTRVTHLMLAGLVPIAMLVPWAVYNASRFSEPVLYTTGLGRAMRQGTCSTTFYGPLIGSYDGACLLIDPPPAPRQGRVPDEAVEDSYYRSLSARYASDHSSQVATVVLARVGRLWGLWNPGQQDVIDHFSEARGSLGLLSWAQRSTFALAVCALAGAWILRRRGTALYPMMAEVGTTVLVASSTFGNTRYRAGVEVVIVVLAAVAVDAALARFRAKDPVRGDAEVVDRTGRRGDIHLIRAGASTLAAVPVLPSEKSSQVLTPSRWSHTSS